MNRLSVKTIDVGTSADPNIVAEIAKTNNSDFIAVSTYSGVALSYLKSLRQEMSLIGLDIPVFCGGKLTQLPEDSISSRPIEVEEELRALGIIVCNKVEDILEYLNNTAKCIFF